MRSVGVEISHGFGDCLFSIPLLRAISVKYNTKIGVATKASNRDAFINIPFIDHIVPINNFYDGEKVLIDLEYQKFIQITPNHYFQKFKDADPNHSLIDTIKTIGDEIACPITDQRPVFIPTTHEFNKCAAFDFGMDDYIAIESEYLSGQSWATSEHINRIVEKYEKTHKIIWLSNTQPPDSPAICDMSDWSRRELILMLNYVDKFFSVGSGFFCASLALSVSRKINTVCLWIDDYYRYIGRIKELGWNDNITWLLNPQELDDYLATAV